MIHLLLHLHLLLLGHIWIHLHHVRVHGLHRLLLHLLLHHLLLALHFLCSSLSLILLFLLHLLLLLRFNFFHGRLGRRHRLFLSCRWLFLLLGCGLSSFSWRWVGICRCFSFRSRYGVWLGVRHFYFAYLLIKNTHFLIITCSFQIEFDLCNKLYSLN